MVLSAVTVPQTLLQNGTTNQRDLAPMCRLGYNPVTLDRKAAPFFYQDQELVHALTMNS